MSYSYDRRTAAAQGSLLGAKMAWAMQLAQEMAVWFKGQGRGGWGRFQVKTDIDSGSDYVTLKVRSDLYGWTGYAQIYMKDQPFIDASISTDSKAPNGDVDLMQLLQQVDDESTKVPIKDTDPTEKLVMAVSLWFSKTLNKLPYDPPDR